VGDTAAMCRRVVQTPGVMNGRTVGSVRRVRGKKKTPPGLVSGRGGTVKVGVARRMRRV
jgi:hypothetical protein